MAKKRLWTSCHFLSMTKEKHKTQNTLVRIASTSVKIKIFPSVSMSATNPIWSLM